MFFFFFFFFFFLFFVVVFFFCLAIGLVSDFGFYRRQTSQPGTIVVVVIVI